MLGFIDWVDLYNKKLHSKTKDLKDQANVSSKESMYRRFLLFKEFYTASTPVIICEGKTDNVYILHAIRSLASAHPQLATKNSDGTIRLNVRIYKYADTSTGRILGINGGTPDLSNLLRLYNREVKKFSAPGAQQPVIVLVDNDAGAKEKGKIFNTVQDITKTKTKIIGNEPFVHVTSNLYVVPTPLKSGVTHSMIEDFFDSDIKSTVLGDKLFDPNNNFDPETHYGKHVFAQKIVRVQADTIDFSGFNAILTNIELVLTVHAKKHPVAPPLP